VVEKPDKKPPALIGGLVLGFLTATPIITSGNTCCCLWIVLGGVLAARLLIKRSPVFPVTNGDGALVGVYAGAVGAVVNLVVGVPLGLLTAPWLLSRYEGVVNRISDSSIRDPILQMLQQAEQAQQAPLSTKIFQALMGWGLNAAIMIGMAALGGVIGVALFEKRKGQPPPPGHPPQGPGYPPPGYPPQGPGYPPQGQGGPQQGPGYDSPDYGAPPNQPPY
jgi:hypothetical protein